MNQARSTVQNATLSRPYGGRAQAIGVAAAIAFACVMVALPVFADGRSSSGISAASGPKAYWQERYRTLLNKADQLRETIETETELYADANRRNHRRGDKRHRHRIKAQEAKDELETVEAELGTIKDDGRRAGALPGWFYDVESERASPASAAESERGPGDAGRNPLYSDDKD